MPNNESAGQQGPCWRTTNKREEKRLLCSDLIQLRWMDRQGARRKEVAILVNYSPSGASLRMSRTIAEGTAVTLRSEGEVLHAIVRHCGPEQNGYVIGVRFWEKPRRYVPEHLLDPSLFH